MFTEKEQEYLRSQTFGRLATIGRDGQPHNVPVGFSYNADLGTIDIAGRGMPDSQKYKNVQRDDRVALLIDDVQGEDHEIVRAIEIKGVAVAARGGKLIRPHCADEIIRIFPARILAWGIDAGIAEGVNSRNVAVHGEAG